jgi:hypothetical protein
MNNKAIRNLCMLHNHNTYVELLTLKLQRNLICFIKAKKILQVIAARTLLITIHCALYIFTKIHWPMTASKTSALRQDSDCFDLFSKCFFRSLQNRHKYKRISIHRLAKKLLCCERNKYIYEQFSKIII